jgi:uncharacterized delta-60 repeat protein
MRIKNLLAVQSVGLLAVIALQAHAAPGDVDLSFDPGSGMNAGVTAIVVQSDGKVLIGGSFTTIQNAYRGSVARLNADGSTDYSFLDGLAGANSPVNCVAVQPDGKVLIAGDFSAVNGLARTGIARLNADGAVDSSFAANLSVEPSSGFFGVTSLALQDDGKVLIGGHFITVGGVIHTNIARLNSDGSLDVSFVCSTGGGYPGYGSVDCLAIQNDSKIIIGGWFTSVNGISRSRLTRLNSNGSLDMSFLPVMGGAGVGPELDSMVLQANGQILIGGWFSTVNGVGRTNLARLNPDGSVDNSFLNGLAGTDNRVMHFALQTDGKILIGGYFSSVNGVARSDMARLNANGSLDTSFFYARPSSVLYVGALALESDGRALVGFTEGTPAAPTYIFRLNADGSQDPSFANGPGGPSDAVLALAVQSDGKSIIGGQFTSISGASRNYLARLNADGSLDGSFMSGLSGPNMYVNGLVLRTDGEMLIQGLFTSVNGSARTGIALLNADGTLDNSFAPSLSAPNSLTIGSLCLQGDNKVLVAGNFTAVNGWPRANLARLNANGSPDSTVNAIAVQADGKVVIGGSFASVNGVSRNKLARLNTDGSLDSSFLAGLVGPNGDVQLLAFQADGSILVGGQFTLVNGLARTNLIRLNPDGSVDPAFAYVAQHSTEDLHALAVQADGKILLSHTDFLSMSGMFNRLNPDGSPDGTFVIALQPRDLSPSAIALQTDGKVLIGGWFSVVNRIPRGYVARLMGAYAPLAVQRAPLSQTAYLGSTVHLTVDAAGYPPPYFLWFASGTNLISCGTSRELELTDVQFAQTVAYTVVVSNACGAVTSAPAMLNVIPAVERRPVPGIKVIGEAGGLLNVEYANFLSPAPSWTTLGSISLTGTSGYCFDLTLPLPSQRFYRTRQATDPLVLPVLDLHMVPAITLTGSIGSSVRADAINRFGPIDAWVTLDTVTLTNTSQLYFDVSAPGQPERLYRLVQVP